ncbi:MAG: phosphoribosylformylglycinamidine synthase subunit PurL [Candidatus Bathyarchaeota archaeon]|nr:MAG: phosphoribosylformylglycinamidine synthase subunit PurL [Candidatus Bathyarchaeota archaeon]
MPLNSAQPIQEVEIISANDIELQKISKGLSLGLNQKEMEAVKRYFSQRRRNPTVVELQTIGQTWSEHCFHKTFKGSVITKKGKIQNLFKTYIAKATDELNLPWCISVFEDNAGIISFHEKFGIAAKVETHNHPSAIEPFGGAATGVGGVIRDILGVWADPIACTDVLGFGPLNYDHNKLPRGIKHPKYLFRGIVDGIGCYGNNMGIPTVNGAIYFDDSYVGNVTVYCGCVGLIPMDKFARNARPGDTILLAGGKTGRDGIHGVTFASAELTEKSEQIARPAVQIANPIEEEKLRRGILKIRDNELASGITDLGGGGLSSAVGEMAYRFKCGAHIQLHRIPLKHDDLAPWEIYISESQERMLLLVPNSSLADVLKIFGEEEVEATPIGKLTDDKILRINYADFEAAHLDIDFLFSPPRTERVARWNQPKSVEPIFPEPSDLNPYVLKLLSSPNIASKEKVVRTYDHEVKGSTVIKPLHGDFGGPNDAAIIKPLQDQWKGVVISCGFNPSYGRVDPYWMAASAIDEAIRNNSAVGGRRIALLDNFVWGSPEKPDRMGSLLRACEACYKFAKEFETPFISGKDSLYNESPLGPVTPSLLITAIGIIPDIRKSVSIDLKMFDNLIYVVGQSFAELGGSEYARLKKHEDGFVPKVRVPQAKYAMEGIVNAIDNDLVRACHDLSEGGLAIAAAEMAISSNLGLELRLNNIACAESVRRKDYLLFSESNSRFLVEVPMGKAPEFSRIMKKVPHSIIGKVTKDPHFCIYGLRNEIVIDLKVDELRRAWKSGLEQQYET